MLVKKFRGTVETRRPRQCGDCVDDDVKFAFAGLQRFLSSSFVINVRKQDIPAESMTFIVPQGKTVRTEPMIHAVSTAQAVINIV